MLSNQLNVLTRYLIDVQNEKLPSDLDLLREIKGFLNTLSREMIDSTQDYLLNEQENIKLMNFWSVAFKSSQMMNGVISKKLNLNYRQ